MATTNETNTTNTAGMSDIRRVLAKASRRLWLIDALRIFAIVVTGVIAAALITRIVQQVFGLLLPWREIAVIAACATAVITLVWSWLARPDERRVAIALDERANLKESLSTALYITQTPMRPGADDASGWAAAVVETARHAAGSVRVSAAVPIEPPKVWPVPIAAGAVLALVWFTLGPIDVLGVHEERVAAAEAERQLQEVKAEAAENIKALEEKLAKAGAKDLLNELGDDANANMKEPGEKDVDAFRRTEVKKLTNLAERLEQMREGEKAAQMDALKESMRQLRQPGPGPMEEVARSMARGDFNKAQEALRQIQRELGDGTMSQEQKDQLKKQAENLAKQLEKLADQKDNLAKKLEQQGLDRKTAQELAEKAAANPEELKKALEQLQNLTPEQREAMQKMAKSAMECGEQCQGMAEAMSKMAQGMSQEGLSQEGMQGMEQMAQELSEMEMMQEDMQALDAAMDEAQRQLAKLGECLGGDCEGNGDQPGPGQGIGRWREGESRRVGQGSGGPGRGDGPSPDSEATDYTTEKVKANVKTQQGPIIGSRLVYGQQLKGESVATFAEAVEAGAKAASEAIEDMTIDREFQDPVKHYFGTLDAKVKAEKGKAPAPAPAAAPAPAPAPAAK
jgi:hypothetical protein